MRFLLADDDGDDRIFFCMSLKTVAPEAECIVARNGPEVLAILKSEAQPPSVLFLDINMPGVSGWEVLLSLKKDPKLQKIPVIMYSTSSNKRDVALAFEFGATAFCTKPDDLKDLRKILEFVISEQQNLTSNTLLNSGIRYFKGV